MLLDDTDDGTDGGTGTTDRREPRDDERRDHTSTASRNGMPISRLTLNACRRTPLPHSSVSTGQARQRRSASSWARGTGYRERHTWRADVTRLPNTVKRDVGAVLADTSFDAVFTGDDVIRQMKAFYPNFSVPLCRTLLERFALPTDKKMEGVLDRDDGEIQDGQIAMGHEPDVLILDEPQRAGHRRARRAARPVARLHGDARAFHPSSVRIIQRTSSPVRRLLLHRPWAYPAAQRTIDRLRDEYAVLILTDEQGGGDGSVACPREAPVGTVSSMHSPMNAAITKRTCPASRWHVATSTNSSQS